jgi:hypothetical protein
MATGPTSLLRTPPRQSRDIARKGNLSPLNKDSQAYNGEGYGNVLLKDVLLAKEQQLWRQQLLEVQQVMKQQEYLTENPESECSRGVRPVSRARSPVRTPSPMRIPSPIRPSSPMRPSSPVRATSPTGGATKPEMWWEGCTPVAETRPKFLNAPERSMQSVIIDNELLQEGLQQVWEYAKSLPSSCKYDGISQEQFADLHRRTCSTFSTQKLALDEYCSSDMDWHCEAGSDEEFDFEIFCHAWRRLVDRYAFNVFVTKGLNAYIDIHMNTLAQMKASPETPQKDHSTPTPPPRKKKLATRQQASVDALSKSYRHKEPLAPTPTSVYSTPSSQDRLYILDSVLVHHQVNSVLMHQESGPDPTVHRPNSSLVRMMKAHQNSPPADWGNRSTEVLTRQSRSQPRPAPKTRARAESRSSPQYKRVFGTVNAPSSPNRRDGGSSALAATLLRHAREREHR